MRVNALAAAEFPDAGVRRHGERGGLLAERLEPPEQIGVAHARQPAVEEHRRRGEDHAAIGVVLILHRGLVADAHRPVAAIALEALDSIRSSIGSLETML